ncbi:MAG: prolipoprotein diacylglyceryl transferase family protein, partial [Bacteroidota bacterium]
MNLLYITWDVSPEIFEIAGFAPRWYSVLFALGFVIGFFIMQSMFKREKVDIELLNSLLMYVVVATVLGARLG